MIIKNLELSNFKVIEHFEGNFEGNVYIVSAENEFGKSTLLDAIAILLSGDKKPVLKRGEKKGFAKAIVGADGKDYEIELKFTEKNPRGTLNIKDNSGMKSDRVGVLQDILGYVDFDVNEFCNWSETAHGRRKQVEMIRSLLPKKTQLDLDKLDASIQSKFEKRKKSNENVDMYQKILISKEEFLCDGDLEKYANKEIVDVLIKEKLEASERNETFRKVVKRQEERILRKDEIPEIIEEINKQQNDNREHFDELRKKAKEEYEKQLKKIVDNEQESLNNLSSKKEKLDNELSEIKNQIPLAESWIKENPIEDLDKIQKKIDNLEEHNLKHRYVVEYNKAKSDLEIAKSKQSDLNKELEQKRKERESLIAKSELPIKGLSFSDEGLTIDGVKLERGSISTSQEIEIAAKILMAKNPKTKVIRVARGESLGTKRLKAIADFAKENNYQGFIEEVKRDQHELTVTKYTEKE